MRGGTSAQVGVDASQLKASLSSWTEAAGAKVKGFVDYGTGSSLDGRKARWCRLQRKVRSPGDAVVELGEGVRMSRGVKDE